MEKTFISYASPNRETANGICTGLESEGVACWIAPRDIRPGAEWETTLVEALSGARSVIVLLSAGANDSGHVVREVRIAGRRRVPLLPLRIEAIEPSPAMEYYLAGLQWLDAFPPPIDRYLPAVVRALTAVAATPPEPLLDEERVLSRLADADDPAALTNIGFISLERGDVADADYWFRRGAEAGDADAAATVGVRLKMSGDPDAAEPWLRQGAEAGDAMAATNLGLVLRDRGDRGAAERWLRQGAEAGDAMAATTLGFVLEESGDRAGAVDWFGRASDAGDQLASDQLRRLEGGGS